MSKCNPLADTILAHHRARVRIEASESQRELWDIQADHAWSAALFMAAGQAFADTDTRDALLAASAAMRERTPLTEA